MPSGTKIINGKSGRFFLWFNLWLEDFEGLNSLALGLGGDCFTFNYNEIIMRSSFLGNIFSDLFPSF